MHKGKVEAKKEQAEKENEQMESYGNLPLGGPAALAGLLGKLLNQFLHIIQLY